MCLRRARCRCWAYLSRITSLFAFFLCAFVIAYCCARPSASTRRRAKEMRAVFFSPLSSLFRFRSPARDRSFASDKRMLTNNTEARPSKQCTRADKRAAVVISLDGIAGSGLRARQRLSEHFSRSVALFCPSDLFLCICACRRRGSKYESLPH